MRRQRRQGRGAKIGLMATAGLILLAGCSSVPDAVNPVEWYKGATGLFEDDAAPAKDQAAREQTASDSSYPNLGSVPARPTDISTPSERRAAQQGLVADREQARYTDQQPSNAVTTGSGQVSTSTTSTARTETRPPAPPAAAPAPAAPAAAPAAAEPAPAAAAPSAPPAARIAARAEPSETVSAGAAMMERRRQEVLAERAAARSTDSTPQQSSGQSSGQVAEQPRTTTPQPEARPEAPATRTETAQAPSASAPTGPTAAEVYREQFARSAAPVATRSTEAQPAATEPAAPAPVPAPTGKAGISYLAATILFGHGSTTLDPSESDSLRKVAAEHRKTGGTLRIVGHASSRTTDMRPLQHQLANFQVSVSRAEAVAQELRRLGVPAKSMEVVGVGDSQPIYYEVMPAGEAGNRRVEIFVDY
ncbi:outer membrane protein OmpA-like peptidoglycan-associated protein [Oceanibaculum indicum]|uniref:Outer membrane protein OmpA-like peptidoglycan-associated protein n=2 Tax=Oceanibaculum indicum TaxID=526216 RepID=A0A420WPW0_9PROT|nr:outer membrane protein OmpA-like peptidoglycan-associated protein [Oceanibaculum indicum]